MRTALEKAEAKHKENVIRLQTHAIFEGVKVDEEMIVRLKQACIKFFEEYSEASGVPKEVLMSVLPSKTVEVALGRFRGILGVSLRYEKEQD